MSTVEASALLWASTLFLVLVLIQMLIEIIERIPAMSTLEIIALLWPSILFLILVAIDKDRFL